jgi:hypothetical protein
VAAVQRCQQRRLFDQVATGAVDKECAAAHARQSIGVDQPARGIGQRHM